MMQDDMSRWVKLTILQYTVAAIGAVLWSAFIHHKYPVAAAVVLAVCVTLILAIWWMKNKPYIRASVQILRDMINRTPGR